MRGHEVDRFRRDHLGRDGQVAFVLAVLVIDHDDHAAGSQFADRGLYGSKLGRFDLPRAGALLSQAKRVTHFLLLSPEVGQGVGGRLDLTGELCDDSIPAARKAAAFAGLFESRRTRRRSEPVEDRGRKAKIPAIRRKPERMIGFDCVEAEVLERMACSLAIRPIPRPS